MWGQANSTLQFLRIKDNATIDDVSFSPPAYNSPMNIYDVILFSNHLQPNINGNIFLHHCSLITGAFKHSLFVIINIFTLFVYK